MVNSHRGEVEVFLDGKPHTLCLTLGALAELEHGFGANGISDLARRLSSETLKSSDLVTIIGAGLRGAGHEFVDDDVARMTAENGLSGFVDAVTRLLSATFGDNS